MITFLGIPIELEEIVSFLKREMLLKGICQKIVYQRIIEQAAAERNLTVTAEEIQAEADRIRYEKRLEKASDTLAWLEEQMVTSDDWEAGIGARLLRQKLANHLFDQEAERYFAQNRINFDRFRLYQIIVPYEELAQEIYYQIDEEEISFYEAAHLYDIDEQRRYKCGYEGKVSRWSLAPDIAAVVGSANTGEVVGPLQTEQGYHLFMIEALIRAELTPQKRQEIINQLFKEWLESEFNSLVYNNSNLPSPDTPDAVK